MLSVNIIDLPRMMRTRMHVLPAMAPVCAHLMRLKLTGTHTKHAHVGRVMQKGP